jgi:hypothetical protein
MGPLTKEALAEFRSKLELLRGCLELMQSKTHLLMQHDLAGLETSLVYEAEMLDRLATVRFESLGELIQPGDEHYGEWKNLRLEMEGMAREMQFVNLTNTTLVRNGLQFAETLYAAVCPPQTYSPCLQVATRPVESTFRVRC